MKRVLQTLRQVADTNATVLLLGESGTSKDTAARAAHHYSPRAERKFVTVNCPSLSSEARRTRSPQRRCASMFPRFIGNAGNIEFEANGHPNDQAFYTFFT